MDSRSIMALAALLVIGLGLGWAKYQAGEPQAVWFVEKVLGW